MLVRLDHSEFVFSDKYNGAALEYQNLSCMRMLGRITLQPWLTSTVAVNAGNFSIMVTFRNIKNGRNNVDASLLAWLAHVISMLVAVAACTFRQMLSVHRLLI